MVDVKVSEEELLADYWGFVRRNLERNGGKDFVVTRRGKLTFAQANLQGNVIHTAIQSRGISRGTGVGLFMKDHLRLVPAILGVLKSEDYYVALDVRLPPAVLLSMLETAEVKLLITDDQNAAVLEQATRGKYQILNISRLEMEQVLPDPPIHYTPEDNVLVIFTSGSTGVPKGAVIDYRNWCRGGYNKMQEVGPDDRILDMTTFIYSSALAKLTAALINGYTIYYYDINEDGLPGLPDWIRSQKLTILQGAPTVFRSLFNLLGADEVFPDVHIFHLGAEKKRLGDVEAVRRHFPGVEWIRLAYGSTEGGMISSGLYPPDYPFPAECFPAGWVYPHMHVFIWDENCQPLPVGMDGEIVVYDNAMVRGYINNPALTQERFIPDPDHPDFQWFRTGDLGRSTEDGQLIHLGRIDSMVKVKGVRVELASIENHILSYPGIIQAAARAFDDPQGNKRLAAYFVSEKDIQVPLSDLRKHLVERLPLHLVPHYLVNLPALPLTGTGKVDLKLLPLPTMVRPALSHPCEPPANELEGKLLDIWEDEIGVKGIGVTDDFFEVGGDSLIGVLVFTRIQETLGVNLPVSTLLVAPTIRTQAVLIRLRNGMVGSSTILPINPQGARIPLFFIPGMGGYPIRIRYLAKKLDPQTPVYALQDLALRPRGFAGMVEAIASLYVSEIRKIAPHGPYTLVGESMGGKIAFEMAQQLQAAGESVPLLTMLDTYNMAVSYKDYYAEHDLAHLWMMLGKHAGILLKSDWKGKLDYLRFQKDTLGGKIKSSLKRRKKKRDRSRVAGLENVRLLEEKNLKAINSYQVRPYPGRVVLFKALRGPLAYDPTNGWDKSALGELLIHPLDCYHGSILFEPIVGQVAVILQGYIDKLASNKS